MRNRERCHPCATTIIYVFNVLKRFSLVRTRHFKESPGCYLQNHPARTYVRVWYGPHSLDITRRVRQIQTSCICRNTNPMEQTRNRGRDAYHTRPNHGANLDSRVSRYPKSENVHDKNHMHNASAERADRPSSDNPTVFVILSSSRTMWPGCWNKIAAVVSVSRTR